MTKQPVDTWLRFFGWMAIGLAIYFFYGAALQLRQGLLAGGRRRQPASPATREFGRG